ncbi:MAG: rRNA adenine N-6-methyltransferase family protein, partial [Patescibacteria group bacterium]
ESKRLILLNEDILNFDLTHQNFAKQTHPNFVQQNLGGQDLSGQETKYHIPNTTYKLVANIPYYLTGQIIRQFLTTTNPPSLMVLMLQKEVAERIARDKKESLLSLSVKAYGQAHYVKTVPAGSFRPIPKVDSAILLIDQISRQHFSDVKMESKFFDLLHRGFSHKRQLLKNNLGLSAEQLEVCGIPAKARAENLSLADWLCLLKI